MTCDNRSMMAMGTWRVEVVAGAAKVTCTRVGAPRPTSTPGPAFDDVVKQITAQALADPNLTRMKRYFFETRQRMDAIRARVAP